MNVEKVISQKFAVDASLKDLDENSSKYRSYIKHVVDEKIHLGKQ